MTTLIAIRDAAPGDEAAWRRLWAGYTAFYQTPVPERVTAATWQRLLEPSAPLFARLAERDRHVVGFAVCVLHAGTWTTAPICYLEDLFVDPPARAGGVGRALIQDLIDRGRAQGWSRLYWHTRAGNAPARRLYDTFAEADDFVRYRLFLD
jgi:GNAT superfamily N-acetyltransferase